MIGALSHRFFHTGKACSAAVSALGKLRKATGYSVSNCKKALEMFPSDVQKAEEWLHNEAKKMGWSKWNKIQSRTAAQGLIGVYSQDNIGIMVEVNCETDFVAKNIEFQKLVGNVIMSCLENQNQFIGKQNNIIEKHLLEEKDLMSLKCQTFSMEELLNSAMSKFNERTVLKRALIMKVHDSPMCFLSGLSHPTTVCPNIQPATIGKFGTLLALEKIDATDEETITIGSNMCQHVIGMTPTSIGTQDFLDLHKAGKINIGETPAKEENVESNKVLEENEGEKNDTEMEESHKLVTKDSEEDRLLFQPYMLNTDINVYEYLWNKANILDFERFECGEEEKKDEEVAKARI